jgi:hypothetical protein
MAQRKSLPSAATAIAGSGRACCSAFVGLRIRERERRMPLEHSLTTALGGHNWQEDHAVPI